MHIYLWALAVSLCINLVMFVPAFAFKTDKLTDISYAVTFIAIVIFGLLHSSRHVLDWIIFVLVTIWALRLGSFLLFRIWRKGKDRRFDGMRDKPWAFLRFWILQGITVFVVMLAALSGFSQKAVPMHDLSWIGAVVFLGGLLLETVADMQKMRFTSNPKNHGRWIDIGVWRTSRHPNYLGEMVVWLGMYLVVAPILPAGQLFVALFSPSFIICLLLFVSGIPILEKSAKDKWGELHEFRRYQSEVPPLIPNFGSVKRIVH